MYRKIINNPFEIGRYNNNNNYGANYSKSLDNNKLRVVKDDVNVNINLIDRIIKNSNDKYLTSEGKNNLMIFLKYSNVNTLSLDINLEYITELIIDRYLVSKYKLNIKFLSYIIVKNIFNVFSSYKPELFKNICYRSLYNNINLLYYNVLYKRK